MIGWLLRWFRTYRQYRPAQIVGRLVAGLRRGLRLTRPPTPPDHAAGTLYPKASFLHHDPWNTAKALRKGRVTFLNETRTMGEPWDWSATSMPLLWRFHLHYFNYLHLLGPNERARLCREWIDRNPPGRGVGWHPYPTSLRIANWCKLFDESAPGAVHDSLYRQAGYVARNLERYLSGNHLLENARALVLAGLYFGDCGEARDWLRTGMKIFREEFAVQVLPDGGHYERSPMYHAQVLEIVLDLINLLQPYDREISDKWKQAAASMRAWLKVMRHPDGEIPFFNDAAFGMAPIPVQLDEYAERLKVSMDEKQHLGRPVHDLTATGYTRVEVGPVVVFIDLAPVGPAHLPAHAHADTLSFELSLHGRRLFVNCGTSQYEPGPRREWERGTAAHNTVEVDGEHSSEVWASFRVARRARVTERKVDESNYGKVRIRGAHDGFRRLAGRPIHYREWRFDPTRVLIVDRVEGAGRHYVDLFLHLHPCWSAVSMGDHESEIEAADGAVRCEVNFEGPGQLQLNQNRYAPEFGLLEPINTLHYHVERSELPVEIRTKISWTDGSDGGAK